MIGLGIWARFFDAAGNKITVPAPPTDPGAEWLWVYIRSQAQALGASFDFVQAPPASLAQGGTGAGCDGYGVAQLWNLGWPHPTRYGGLEDLLAMIAALNACGTRTYFDLVLHQILGPENEGPGRSTYLGADGKTLNGRGATTPGWFRGNTQPILENGVGTGAFHDPVPPFCMEDQVPSRSADVPFGREVSFEHCDPPGVTQANAIALVRWITQRTGVQDFRLDDVKGMYAPAVAAIMQAAPKASFYSEYFDNTQNAGAWARSVGGRSAMEDFDLHFRTLAACNGFDATLFDEGGAGGWASGSGDWIGFVDNPDTDTSPGEQVIFNKGIAYARLLNLPLRAAIVYGKDYMPASVWPGAYGLHELIDNLCWISRTFAIGAFERRWVDTDVYAFTRDGNGGHLGWSGGLLVATNFNVLSPRTITVGTPFGPNKWLHDYTGHHGDIWTDVWGNATFTIPSNAYSAGQSYVCFAPGGVDKPYPASSRATTQTFVGDQTLDVLPVKNGLQTLPQRIACAGGTTVQAVLKLAREGVSEDATVQLEVFAPDNTRLAWATTGTMPTATAFATVKASGWYTLRLVGNLLPEAGVNYELQVTYKAAA